MKISLTRKQMLISLGAFVLISLCLWLAWPPTEPVHQGMTLSECLAAQDPLLPGYTREQERKADDAIRQMGSDAVPHLIRMLKTRDSFLRNVYRAVHHQWGWLDEPLSLQQIHWRAVTGLALLGPQARPAAQEVIHLLYDRDENMRRSCLSLLDSMDMEAEAMIPHLRQAFHDPSEMLLSKALEIAIKRGPSVKPVVSFQTALFQHTDFTIRSQTLAALLAMNPDATNALLPLIKQQLADAHPMTRGRAMVAYVRYEADPEIRTRELTRLLADPDVCVRFKATNLIAGITPPEKPQGTDHEFHIHDVSPSDLLFVYERLTGTRFLLSPGLQFNRSISMDTFGFLSIQDSLELMKRVLKEEAGWDFLTLADGNVQVTQGSAPPLRTP